MGAPTGDFAVNWAPLPTSNPFTPASFTQIDTAKNLQLVSGEGVLPTGAYAVHPLRWVYSGAMQFSPAVLRAKFEVSTAHSGDVLYAYVGDALGNGYCLSVSSLNLGISKINAAGAVTGLVSGTTPAINAGDIFQLEYTVGTKGLKAYQNGSAISGLSTSDSTYTPTTFGFAFEPGNTNGSQMAAFAGDGALVALAGQFQRRVYLPPGPGRWAGKSPGFGVGPFVNFMVRDLHRMVPTLLPWAANASDTSQGGGSLTALNPIAGAATEDTTLAGLLATAIQLAAAATAVANAAAQLNTQITLAGAIQSLTSTTANLQTAILAGSSATEDTSGSGTLSQATMVAAATEDSTGSGSINTQILLVGAIASATSAIANVATQILLQANALSVTSALASIQSGIPVAGGASDTSAGAGSISTGIPLTGAAAAATTAAASVITAIQAIANAADGSAAVGSLKTGTILTQAIASLSVAAGTLSTAIQAAAAAQAQGLAVGALTTQGRFASSASDDSAGSGSLKTAKEMAADGTADSSLTAAVTVGAKLAGDAEDDSAGAAGLTTFLDPDAAAVAESTATGALAAAGSTYFRPDAIFVAPPEGFWPPNGLLPFGMRFQQVGEMLIYAIDWSEWLANRWLPFAKVVAGDVVRPTRAGNIQLLCVTGGYTGRKEPAWPENVGAQVLDGGSVEWQVEAADQNSLAVEIASATWSASTPAVIGFSSARTVNAALTVVTVDTTNAVSGTDYDIFCQIGTSDERTKIGKFRLKVR